MLDLSGRFTLLWQRLAALTPPEPVFSALLQAYSEPHRSYHNVTHLCHCLEELDTARSLAEYPDEVEVALWFHDAVYEPLAKDNEARSAALAEQELLAASVSQGIIARVVSLTMATKHDGSPTTLDAQLIVDIDLAILGQPPERFDAYEAGIRREYSMVPEDQFRQGRTVILEAFLRRPAIYHTDHFREQYEATARENLQRSLQLLTP
jgi:predicted metal-dependent HD superfamily phosphohydrolase